MEEVCVERKDLSDKVISRTDSRPGPISSRTTFKDADLYGGHGLGVEKLCRHLARQCEWRTEVEPCRRIVILGAAVKLKWRPIERIVVGVAGMKQ